MNRQIENSNRAYYVSCLLLVLVLGLSERHLWAQGNSGKGSSDAPAGGGSPVAILDSARTRNYFASAYGYCVPGSADPDAVGAMEYKRYWGGWEQVLKEMKASGHIPGYDIVSDDFITSPTGLAKSGYKVLVLSNNANMSQAMVDAIRSWVSGGGRILATFGSGYEAAADSVDEALKSKPNKNSLEQLWNDPLTKYVTTGTFGTVSPPEGGYPPGSVEAIITTSGGPTASYCQFYQADNGAACPWYFDLYRLVSGYGDLAIMLLGRSESWPGSYAHFQFANNLAVYDPLNQWPDTQYSKPLPAVVANSYRKGKALYYAFAPEFIVGLEFDVAGHCSDDPNFPGGDPAPGQQEVDKLWEHNRWVGRTPELRALMKSGIHFLLTAP